MSCYTSGIAVERCILHPPISTPDPVLDSAEPRRVVRVHDYVRYPNMQRARHLRHSAPFDQPQNKRPEEKPQSANHLEAQKTASHLEKTRKGKN